MSNIQPYKSFKSPLAKARGLGSARTGSHHWWLQRVTAIVLLPLTLWFVFSIISLVDHSRQQVVEWLSSPLSLSLMIAFILATFYHLNLGLQVVIEDYVHSRSLKTASLLAMKAACYLLSLLCIISALTCAIKLKG